MKNKKILKIRKKLDTLDIELLKIIKKRTILVDQILQTKKYKKQIIDKKRISYIIKKIKNKSKKMNLDTIITKRIWINMIKAFIDYEYRNFNKK